MKEIVFEVLNDMAEDLSVLQLKKLQEVLLKRFAEEEHTSEPAKNVEYLNMFIHAKKIEGCSDRTIAYYRSTIETMFCSITTPVRKITTEDIRIYLSEYQKKNNCGKTTLDNIRRNISSFFSWLEEEDHILKSPIRRIHKIKTKTTVKEVISDEDIEKLRDSCDVPRDMAIIDYLPVSDFKDGVITVPAKLLAEFVSNLPKGQTITITEKDSKITIVSGKYKSVINGSPADDFPELPELNDKNSVVFKLGIDEFKNSISQVIIASSNDLTRPALTGIYFNTKDKELAIAATDGYRLAEKKLIKNVQSEVGVIVPTTTLQEVLRTISDDMEEIELSFSDDLVRFRLGEVEIISKLIDASFPDYRRLIPKDNNIKLTINRDELVRVTKLASLFARSVNGSIICEAKKPNTFSVKSVASELGENDSTIETKVNAEGKVTLNSRFLSDALNALDSKEIIFEFSPNITPVVLKNQKNEDYTHIVMPLNS